MKVRTVDWKGHLKEGFHIIPIIIVISQLEVWKVSVKGYHRLINTHTLGKSIRRINLISVDHYIIIKPICIILDNQLFSVLVPTYLLNMVLFLKTTVWLYGLVLMNCLCLLADLVP